MNDHTELKRLAKAAPEGPWYQHGGIKQVLNHDCETVCETFEEDGDCPTARFIAAANPTAVLALIAENERLAKTADCWDRLNVQNKALSDSFRAERDQLRAEIAGLKTGYEAYERVNAELKAECEALRKDADRLQSATAFVQKPCDSAGKQPSVATGYLHDILSALGQGEQS